MTEYPAYSRIVWLTHYSSPQIRYLAEPPTTSFVSGPSQRTPMAELAGSPARILAPISATEVNLCAIMAVLYTAYFVKKPGGQTMSPRLFRRRIRHLGWK
jgi:hypothetical protein